MQQPTLRQLHYLKLLFEHGSFSRAAEAAHVTQPTLSAGIKELEAALGGPVVDRGRGSGLIFTLAGEAAVAGARDVLGRVEDLTLAARVAAQPLTGRFRLGVIPTVAPFLLPRALSHLRERFPALRLYLREDQTPRLVESLRTGALDAALIALPYDTSGLETALVGADELLAAAPADHPLARGDTVDAAALQGEDLILLEGGHCLRDHALAACDLNGAGRAAAEANFAATSLHTLAQMVGSGLGVSLIPAMAVEAGLARAAGVAIRPLRAYAAREIVVAWRAGSTRGAEARMLTDALRQV